MLQKVGDLQESRDFRANVIPSGQCGSRLKAIVEVEAFRPDLARAVPRPDRSKGDSPRSIKAGRIPEARKAAKLAQKDRDARWTVKWSKAKPSENGSPRMADRERVGREASPSAAVIDSQSVLVLDPQPANVQDRDGAPLILRLSRRSFPFITKAFADMGFAGNGPANATSITIEIVRK